MRLIYLFHNRTQHNRFYSDSLKDNKQGVYLFKKFTKLNYILSIRTLEVLCNGYFCVNFTRQRKAHVLDLITIFMHVCVISETKSALVSY